MRSYHKHEDEYMQWLLQYYVMAFPQGRWALIVDKKHKHQVSNLISDTVTYVRALSRLFIINHIVSTLTQKWIVLLEILFPTWCMTVEWSVPPLCPEKDGRNNLIIKYLRVSVFGNSFDCNVAKTTEICLRLQ